MAKKKKKSWKKKLLKAALIGGALYGGSKLLKNRRAASIADMDDAGIGVTHPALTDTAPVAENVVPADTKPIIGTGGGGIHQGKPKKINPWRGVAPAPPGILNPYRAPLNTMDPHQYRWPNKGGGIAKRGKGAAYKKGGRVTGIAKRGFGRALMKGKK